VATQLVATQEGLSYQTLVRELVLFIKYNDQVMKGDLTGRAECVRENGNGYRVLVGAEAK
jgi:hypothetical protein